MTNIELEDFANLLIKDYLENSDVCMAEYLGSTPVQHPMTIEDAFKLYIVCMKYVDQDEFYVIKEGETIEL